MCKRMDDLIYFIYFSLERFTSLVPVFGWDWGGTYFKDVDVVLDFKTRRHML